MMELGVLGIKMGYIYLIHNGIKFVYKIEFSSLPPFVVLFYFQSLLSFKVN